MSKERVEPGTNAPTRRETVEIVPVLAETLQVGKRTVETGRVVIHKTVSERDEVVEALLARQDVTVERVTVGREIADPPAPRQEGDTWVVPILEEVLVVEKRLVLKEELRIRTATRQETVERTVRLRQEHVTIEDKHFDEDTQPGEPQPVTS